MKSKKLIGFIAVLAVISLVFAGAAAAASETSSDTAILVQNYSDGIIIGGGAFGDVAAKEAVAAKTTDGARAANGVILVTTKAAASDTAADAREVRGMGYLSTAAGAIHDVFNTTEKANTSSSTVKTMKDSRSSGMSSFHSQVTSDTENVANLNKNDSFSTDVAGLTNTSNMTQAKKPIILVGLNSFGSNVNFAGLNNTFNLSDYYSFANLSRFGTNANSAALNSAFNYFNLYNLAALNSTLNTTPVFLIDVNSYMKNLNTVSTNADSTLRADLSRLTEDVNTTANVNTTSNVNSDTTNLSSFKIFVVD